MFVSLRSARSLAGAVALAATSTALAQFSVSPAVNYPIGIKPHGVAALDFDGDGDLDVVAAVDTPDRLAILINTGDGVYAAGPSFPLGSGMSAGDIVAADFTNDGIVDVAVALKGPEIVQIWKGANGTLTLVGSFPTGATPMGLTAADADHDGDIDICLANRDSDTATVATNDGNGSTWTVTTVSGGFDRPRGATFGDFDGDGLADLAVTSHDNRQVMVFHNAGGAFPLAKTINLDPKRRPEGIKSADLNGDGLSDIVCASNGGGFNSVSVILATGAMGFAAPAHYDSGGTDPAHVALGDLNCDGSTDVAVLNTTSGSVSLLANGGSGTLGAALAMTVGSSPDGIVVADIDSDGDADVITGNELSNDVSIIRSTCSSTIPVCGNGICEAGEDPNCIDCQGQGGGPGAWILANAVTYSVGAVPGGVAAADIDHDGFMDLAIPVDAPDRVITLMNNGDGTYHAGQSLSVGNYWVGLGEIASGDFNGDGWTDFAITLKGGLKVRILVNNQGVLSNGPSFPTGNTPRGLSVADADNDGDLDITVANRLGNSATFLRNDGALSFTSVTTLPTGVDPRAAAFGDFDGDGIQEIAVTNHEDRTISILKLSRGSYVTATTLEAGERPEGIMCGDLNGDGFDDIVVAASGDIPTNNGIEVIKSAGGMAFGPAVFHPAGGLGGSHVALGDLDCDGDLDVVLVNETSAEIALLPNNGSGNFGTATAAAVGSLPEAVVLANLDGDSDLDIAVVNKLTGDASIILNNTCGAATPPTGDLDGDGHVGASDIAILLGQWGGAGSADLNGSGDVGASDLAILLGQWG